MDKNRTKQHPKVKGITRPFSITAIFLVFSLFYVGFLNTQKNSLQVQAQIVDEPGQEPRLCTSGGSISRCFCQGNSVMQQATDGSVSSLKDCATESKTCYTVNYNNSEYTATCLYNPPIVATPVGSSGGSGNTGANSSLAQLISEVSATSKVPVKVLEGVMRIETPNTFTYSPDQVRQYSTPGATIPGCGPNECSAAGAMQMTTGVDRNGSSTCSSCCYPSCLIRCPNAWSQYGQGGNVCNLKDNVLGAARKLRFDSGATSPDNWSQTEVYKAARAYYGVCGPTHVYAHLGNRTYCQFVWWYYTGLEGPVNFNG